MTSDSIEDRTLTKNNVRNFILKIDLIKNENFHLNKVVEKLSAYFDRTEKRLVNNFTINFTNTISEISQDDTYDYVLISESRNISMTFSETQNLFLLETSSYKNNTVYKDIIKQTIDIIKYYSDDIESKRIGLRYINEFECKQKKDISRIFDKRLSSIVKNMLLLNNQNRTIAIEEYIDENQTFLKLQYGIPNKFYPSKLATYDLLLDIDSYSSATNNIDDWEQVIRTLNHSAYDSFKLSLNENFLEKLK